MAKKCSPPKSQGVKAHARGRPIQRKKIAQARRAKLPYAVVNSRTGQVVSRHRYLTTAIRERTRLDRISFRAGNGRPYDTRKVK